MTSDVSRNALNGVYRLIKAQEEIHLPLLNLRGKIDILCSHASEYQCESSNGEELFTPAFIFDDSDGESEDIFAVTKMYHKDNENTGKEIEDSYHEMNDIVDNTNIYSNSETEEKDSELSE